MKIIVTIDVEEDSGPGWICPPKSRFLGITEGIRNRLQPLFRELGMKPTLLISPIVLHHQESVDVLASLEQMELGAHLHWDQIEPGALRTTKGGLQKSAAMQWDYPPESEREKLESLTQLFKQKFGFLPTSFRAGRYGASISTGKFLKQLGYIVDSSATPHVKWPTQHNEWIDYTQVPEQPYAISETDNIYQTGNSDFLEVPITILAKEAIPSAAKQPWFRPAYSTRDTLMEIVRIVRERNSCGQEQPLVMMFHNVEVIPNASPYTSTEEDVRAYLDDIRSVLTYALHLGFKSCTLTEYAREYKNEIEKASKTAQEYEESLKSTAQLNNGIGIPYADVRRAVERHGSPAWHHGIYRNRDERWDVKIISLWTEKHIARDAAILSAGCGCGFNLYWLARQGFSNLNGFDVDKRNIDASLELLNRFGFSINLWVADMIAPPQGLDGKYDFIEAMNCMMYDVNTYQSFLAAYLPTLKPGGYLAFDAIDTSFSAHPDNHWESNDWSKPITERRPSEYVTRYSQEEIIALTAPFNLKLTEIFFAPDVVPPRKIYIFQKTL